MAPVRTGARLAYDDPAYRNAYDNKPSAWMSYRDGLRAAISPYSPSDRDEVLAFRREMYGATSTYADPGYLRWMYEWATDGDRSRGSMWLYRKDGKVEGQQGGLRVTVELRGRSYEAYWALDLVVNPRFQLRGIGAVLPEVAFGENAITLGTEVSDAARRSFLRAGWIDMGTLPLYVRPMSLARLARARGHRHAAAVLGTAGDLTLRTADRALHAAVRLSGVRLEPVRAFDDRSDRLWSEVAVHYPVACRRDAEFLDWRFARFPAERYRMYYAFRGRELVGHLVLRSGRWNGLPAGFIVDFLCAPRWTGALMAAALGEFRGEPLAAVYCLHLNPVSTRSLSALGFLRHDSGWRFMCRSHSLPPEAQAALSDPRSWFLTWADSNLDRQREGTSMTPAAER